MIKVKGLSDHVSKKDPNVERQIVFNYSISCYVEKLTLNKITHQFIVVNEIIEFRQKLESVDVEDHLDVLQCSNSDKYDLDIETLVVNEKQNK